MAPDSRGVTAIVYTRNENPKGPMSVFGYDYLVDHLGQEQGRRTRAAVLTGLRAEGESYALEALNFVDGKRSVQSIRDALSAEFGPVPLEPVVQYLEALETIGVLRR